MEFTKQTAKHLWSKFADHKEVKKECKGYGPGAGYVQFILSFKKNGVEAQLTLITKDLQAIQALDETHTKELCTPFGNYDLTVEEATKCREAWHFCSIKKDTNKLTYDELIRAMNG